ncbi:hypothetical protein GCM10025864_44580 [Luteimicrobium album]|nr:hypothetical protein [Luteimicrobium album]GMA26699.1 hypothetical protein GCM10025864_44580 [Luteimicrobium album]
MVAQMLPAQPRFGFITAVDTGQQLVTVAFEDGSTTTSLSWASSAYPSPAVGDRVSVVPHTTGWLVVSKATPRPVLVPDQQVLVLPSHNYGGEQEIPTDGSAPGAWWWADTDATDSDFSRTFIEQGLSDAQAGDTEGHRPPYNYLHATALTYPLAASVPSGATISQVQIILRCSSTFAGGSGSAHPVAPIMYAHTYTALPSGAPAWAPGYGPIRFPTFIIGEIQVLTVPAAWVTAWLASTIAGIGFYAPATSLDAFFSHQDSDGDDSGTGQLLITYSGGS